MMEGTVAPVGPRKPRNEFVAKAVRDWIAAVGAKTAYIEPGSTWENGYCESFKAKLRDELLNGEILYSLEPRLDAVGSRAEHRDLVMRPECGDALPGPSVAMAGQQTVSIEDAGDQIVGGQENELTYRRDDLRCCAVALAATPLRQERTGSLRPQRRQRTRPASRASPCLGAPWCRLVGVLSLTIARIASARSQLT